MIREEFSTAEERTRETTETVGDLKLAQGQFADGDTAYADAEVKFTSLSCPLNRVLVSLRRLIARQLGWDSPQVTRAREEFEELTRRSISFEESRRWPPAKKGSVFHGSLEMTG
jgi:hypothetical protein